MTKLQLVYDLVRPLNDTDAAAFAAVHSTYGMQHVKVAPSPDKMTLDKIEVEYDASRLSEKDVESVLIHNGIPIQRKWETT